MVNICSLRFLLIRKANQGLLMALSGEGAGVAGARI